MQSEPGSPAVSEPIADPHLCNCGSPNGHALTCRMVTAHAAALRRWRGEPDETPQKRVARRLLGIAAIEKLLAAEKAKLRREAAEVFDTPGDRAAVLLPDGTPLGNVRADKGTAAGWKVTDAGALRAWVEATGIVDGIVEQVTTVVDPELVEHMLGDLNGGQTDMWADPQTGEVLTSPPGITYVPAGPPKLVTTADKAAPEAVRRLLGDQAALIGIES